MVVSYMDQIRLLRAQLTFLSTVRLLVTKDPSRRVVLSLAWAVLRRSWTALCRRSCRGRGTWYILHLPPVPGY